MALGIVTTSDEIGQNPRYVTIKIIENALAATGQPPEATWEEALKEAPTPDQFFDLRLIKKNRRIPREALLYVCNTAGTNPVSISYVRVWVYDAITEKKYPWGIGADADKGKLNNGAALGETNTNELRHAEVVYYLDMWDGVQVEVGVTGGTGAEAFDVYLRFYTGEG